MLHSHVHIVLAPSASFAGRCTHREESGVRPTDSSDNTGLNSAGSCLGTTWGRLTCFLEQYDFVIDIMISTIVTWSYSITQATFCMIRDSLPLFTCYKYGAVSLSLPFTLLKD